MLNDGTAVVFYLLFLDLSTVGRCRLTLSTPR